MHFDFDTYLVKSYLRTATPAFLFFLLGGLFAFFISNRREKTVLQHLLSLKSYLLSRTFGARAANRMVSVEDSEPNEGRSAASSSFDAVGSPTEMIADVRANVESLIDDYELMSANIAAAVTIRNANGKLLFCTPYAQVITGYSLEELYAYEGDFFSDLAVEEDRMRYERAQQVSRLGEDILVRYRINHGSGLQLWLETRLVPVTDHMGKLLSVMGVTIDVTDTLNYQHQIELQNKDLSDFAYMISHDLKAPVFTIKGMAGALLEDCKAKLSESELELVGYIVEASDRLDKLIAGVIEYSSISSRDVETSEIDVNGVLQNVISDLREQIKAKNATVDVESGIAAVRADELRVYQIFSNLLGNALKYCSPERPCEIKITSQPTDGHRLVIDVTDNGLGIPADKLDDIFRPYKRAHGNDIEGSGIGLACVQKMLHQLKGSVSVQSREGFGSTFSVELPTPPPKPREIPTELAHCFRD